MFRKWIFVKFFDFIQKILKFLISQFKLTNFEIHEKEIQILNLTISKKSRKNKDVCTK